METFYKKFSGPGWEALGGNSLGQLGENALETLGKAIKSGLFINKQQNTLLFIKKRTLKTRFLHYFS